MTAIVMNTLNASVTEYDWTFNSLSPTRAGATSGLCALGGDDDAGAAIAGSVMTGRTLALDQTRKAAIEDVYFGLRGAGNGVCRIEADDGAWEYPVAVKASGVSRAVPGKGISENYVALGYRNAAGEAFRLDRIEPTVVQSKQRKT